MIRKLMMVALGFLLISSTAIASSHMKKDIVDTAVGAGSFTTLAAALTGRGFGRYVKRARAFHSICANR